MKFWLTLILSTIVISALLTVLVMYQGSQGLPDVMEVAATTLQEPPMVTFQGVKMEANIIPMEVKECFVNKPCAVEIPFKNEGKGTLRIRLTRVSCGCVHEVTIDGKKLEPEKNVIEIPSGQGGTLRFSWVPEQKQLSAGGRLILSADFIFNDPRPQFSSDTRLEIKTTVKPAG